MAGFSAALAADPRLDVANRNVRLAVHRFGRRIAVELLLLAVAGIVVVAVAVPDGSSRLTVGGRLATVPLLALLGGLLLRRRRSVPEAVVRYLRLMLRVRRQLQLAVLLLTGSVALLAAGLVALGAGASPGPTAGLLLTPAMAAAFGAAVVLGFAPADRPRRRR